MCGICGKLSHDGVDPDTLRRMADEIRHRGPDDDGYYLKGGVGLANRRLSIIDLSTGKQPISNEDGTVWVVYNGESYNYPDVRRMLEGRGHVFKTQSDTEVIVHLYEDYGVDCVKHLRGMFAFALWDEKASRLLLARDPLGQKPIYYVHRDGEFIFGSEIKAILREGSVRPRLNTRAMDSFISLRYMPGEDTLFEGVRKIPAGHTLVYEGGQVTVRRYWDLRYGPKLEGSEEEITARLRDLLLDTISRHMLSDVPLGTFLSGGIDSSLVTAMMCTISDAPVKTFSIGVRDQGFNELPYARMVADRYKTEHYELVVDPDVVGALPQMLWHMEEPVDPFAFGVYSVARLASQHVKVALGGDGGDEMFAGYDRYLGNQLVDLYCLVPSPIRKGVLEPLIRRLPDNHGYNNRVQKLRWMAAMSESSAGERYAQSAAFLRFGRAHKEPLYTQELWRDLAGNDASAELVGFFDARNAHNNVDKMLYTDVKTRLADHLLMVVDRMTMAHSLEGRSPYVDQVVAEFAARIPAGLKLHGRRLKHIAREVAKEYLPGELLNRGKQGFAFPIARWFKGDLRGLAEQMFAGSRMVDEGYFRSEAMRDLLDEHVSGRADHNYRLWLLFNLELWHRMFVDGEPAHELEEMLRGHIGSGTADGARAGTSLRQVART